MNILNAIRTWLIKMLTKSDVKNNYGKDIAMTSTMQNAIQFWSNMYSGRAEWLDKDLGIHSLRLEQAITREFVNTVINEMTVTIADARLDEIFKNATKQLNVNLQRGLATGAMVIKPLGADGVQYVPQGAFVPIEYDCNGRLIKVIFPEIKQVSESTWLTRLEYHSLDYNNGLTITNRAYLSSSQNKLGHEIPLASIIEWATLPTEITYPDMLRPAFGYYVNPLDNTIDGTTTGVSIFAPAVDLIRKVDIQASRLDWEFESGERAINVDDMALKVTNGKGGERELPRLNKRLYRGLNIDGGSSGDFFKEFSPQLRQADYIAGLEEYKREIEFVVGLSYGDISNPQSIDKTATEIKSSKQRKYDTVMAIQRQLKICLEDLCYALAFYNSMTKYYDIIVDFEDSILADDDTQRASDRQDVAMGVMQLWEYRMKWYSEDEKTAKAMTASEAEVIE